MRLNKVRKRDDVKRRRKIIKTKEKGKITERRKDCNKEEWR